MERFVLSTEDVNEYGFWVVTKGVDLRSFISNPIMLYEHEKETAGGSYGYKEKLPIGKWTDITAKDGVISAVPEFDEGDTFAMEVKRKVENGFLSATSAGFKPIELSDDKQWLKPGQFRMTLVKSRIKEASFVKFPANLAAVRLYDDHGQVINLSDNTKLDGIIPSLLLNENKLLSMKQIAIKLGLSENATEEQVLAALNVLLNERTDMLMLSARQKGIVNDQNEAHFREMAKTNFQAAQQFILSAQAPTVIPKANEGEGKKEEEQQISVTQILNALKNGEDATLKDRSNWDYNDWELKDQEGLLKMRNENPAQYEALVKNYKPRKK